MPAWLDELAVVLAQPDKRWIDKVEVDLVAATRELTAWLCDKRPYEGRHKQGWESAIHDFLHAASPLGPEMRSNLGGDLVSCKSIAHDLLAASTRHFEALLTSHRAEYQATLQNLLNRLVEEDNRLAAWRDLVTTCRDIVAPNQQLAMRRDLLWAIMRAANYNPKRTALSLSAVLRDQAFDIFVAKISLGDTENPEAVDYPHLREFAGLDENERLILCERLLTTSPRQARNVVWVAFRNAYLHRTVQAVGPISFYDVDWIKSCLDAEYFPDQFPVELCSTDSHFRSSDLPQERDIVLARIDLGISSFPDPVRVAREQAEAVVALAGFQYGASKWRLLQGYLYAIDGRVSGMGPFVTPLDIDSLPQSAGLDPMSDNLADIEVDLASHLPVSSSELLEIIDALRAWQDARNQEPLSSIVLYVRILELTATRAGNGQWYKYLDEYFAAAWVRHNIHEMLHLTAYEAAYHHIDGLSVTEHNMRREIQLSIFRSISYGHRANLVEALKGMAFFADLYPPHGELARKVAYVTATLSTPASIAALRDELAEQWRLSLSRLQRVRNALSRGGPVDNDSAKTVHEFVRQLTAWGLSRSLEGILKGNGVLVAHEQYRDKAIEWYEAVPTAKDAKDALFR